jgi:hypothetical protein
LNTLRPRTLTEALHLPFAAEVTYAVVRHRMTDKVRPLSGGQILIDSLFNKPMRVETLQVHDVVRRFAQDGHRVRKLWLIGRANALLNCHSKV